MPIRSATDKVTFGRVALTVAGIILLSGTAAVQSEVKLLGVATFPGDATDLSDASAELAGGTPANRFGGISGIEYTGTDDRYLLIPDRGPADGATSYRCRFHVMRMPVRPGAAKPVTASLVSTTFLRNEKGEHLVGATSAFAADDPSKGLRFDPESIRRVDGRLFLSDEYGPFMAEFTEAARESGCCLCRLAFRSRTLRPTRTRRTGTTRRGARPMPAWKGWPSRPTASTSWE